MTTETTLNEEEIPLEYQVFALCMKQAGAINRFSVEVPPHIVGQIHGKTGLHEFYLAFLDFHKKTGLDVVDPIAFKSWLENETDIPESLGGIGGVSFFLDQVNKIEVASIDSVIKILKVRAAKRQQLTDLQTLKTLLEKKGTKSDTELNEITRITERIRAAESELDYDPFEVIDTGFDIAARAANLTDIPNFIRTPFKKYNQALGYTEDGGYFKGAVHAIVGRSGIGKSTLAKSLCNFWLDEGHSVLFVNFEEAQAHWERILMTQIIGENVYAKAKTWSDNTRKEKIITFTEKLESWGKRLMVRHDPDTSYFEDLELWLRDIIGHDASPDVVVIDTIQSMFTKGGGSVRWAEFEKMMVRLEKLAKDMDAVFIITVQQNTEAAKEKREIVEQRDVGGSTSIVQKCSVVTFLTEKQLVSGDDSLTMDKVIQLQIPKNRITGKVFMQDPPLLRYNDETKSYEDWDELDDPDAIYGNADTTLAIDALGLGDFNT